MSEKMKVPSRYPEDRPLSVDSGQWWVLHTKPNCEKRVASYLVSRQIPYYFPQVTVKERYGNLGRVRFNDIPLFRGYICFALDKENHGLLYDSKKLVRIIKVDDQERFVRELEAVAKAVESEQELLVKPGLVPGKRVLILSGPLKDTEGVIVRKRKKQSLALSVHMFNQTVLVDLDPLTDVEVLS